MPKYHTKQQDSYLRLQKAGKYEILQVRDRHCIGWIPSLNAEIEVQYIARPQIRLVEPALSSAVSLDRPSVCSGEQRATDLAFQGESAVISLDGKGRNLTRLSRIMSFRSPAFPLSVPAHPQARGTQNRSQDAGASSVGTADEISPFQRAGPAYLRDYRSRGSLVRLPKPQRCQEATYHASAYSRRSANRQDP